MATSDETNRDGALQRMSQAFLEGLSHDLATQASVLALPLEEAERMARSAGERMATEIAWRRAVGPSLDTSEVVELLGITRQALNSRKKTGSVLALPASGTSIYPTWQFDAGTIRDVTRQIVAAFRATDREISLFTIAAFAQSPQPELENETPARWIASGRKNEQVVLAARRAAHSESQ